MNNLLSRFPKLALPFTILTEKNKVRLIAGEDFRYTFTAPDLDSWAPQVLDKLDGKTQVKDLLTEFAQSQQNNVIDLITRLYGERILVDGLMDIPLNQKPCSLKLFGKGLVFEKLKENSVESQNLVLVLCQEDLNYYELLEFNKMALKSSKPWFWVSYGAMTRGFVSPIFLPQAGSCLACLLDQFQRLSPMPELYQELINYGKENKEFTGVSFPNEGLEILRSLVLWKLALFNKEASQAPIYRLHVLEVESLEVSSHRVFANPDCIYCDERY